MRGASPAGRPNERTLLWRADHLCRVDRVSLSSIPGAINVGLGIDGAILQPTIPHLTRSIAAPLSPVSWYLAVARDRWR